MRQLAGVVTFVMGDFFEQFLEFQGAGLSGKFVKYAPACAFGVSQRIEKLFNVIFHHQYSRWTPPSPAERHGLHKDEFQRLQPSVWLPLSRLRSKGELADDRVAAASWWRFAPPNLIYITGTTGQYAARKRL